LIFDGFYDTPQILEYLKKDSLKELRETMIWLKIIARKRLGDVGQGAAAIAECNELIAIFVRSTKTADEKRHQ